MFESTPPTTLKIAEQSLRGLMGDTKFFEGYSRFDASTGKYESWKDAVRRVMDTHRTYYKDRMTPELEEAISKAQTYYEGKYVLGAQRALQFGGEQLLKHQMRLYNCTSSHADRVSFFGEYFYILLCGAGAGFSVQKHHVSKLPMIRPRTKQPKTHVIEDSIEGWATALDVLLSSFFIGGGVHSEYEGRRVYFDSTHIRSKGAPISGGFKAPGPEPLMKALNNIERLLVGRAEEGILRPIDVYDICMHTADAVLSGGVRRAATICLFSPDDEEMMTAKTGNWFNDNPQRARSNNSMVLLRNSDMTEEQFLEIMTHVREFGEPGFVFVESLEHCFNPCVEIGMYPKTEDDISGWQGCNLTEINGSLCTTPEAFFSACEAASILGTLQAGYTNFKFLNETTRKIFEREALLGVSITGWMNSPSVLFDEENLRRGAGIVKETNRRIAALLGINPAARTTCVKPAGNASVLLGTASGIHPEHSKKYLRTIQINKQQEVCEVFRDLNPYMIEESVWSATNSDYVITFPIIAPEGSHFKDDYTGIKLLEKVKFVQQIWVESGTNIEHCVDSTVRHNVSNTITVRNDEWEAVGRYLYQNRQWFAGVSLLSETGDRDYFQAPNIEVLEPQEIVDRWGAGAIFASGLIVDSSKGFNNLWEAISIARFNHDKSNQELRDVRADWIRRFNKFADNYFGGDTQKTEYCLKDVYILHKWMKIQQNYRHVDLENLLKEVKIIDIDTQGAVACAAGGCQI